MRKFRLADLPAICRGILTGKSLREVAGQYGCSPSTVHEYREILKKKRITYEDLLTMPLDELIRQVCPGTGRVYVTNNSVRVINRRSRSDERDNSERPNLTAIAKKVDEDGTRMWNAWVDYRDSCLDRGLRPMSRSWFYDELREELKKLKPDDIKTSMSQEHRYGEALMIDWSGTELEFIDADGNTVRYPLFVAVFPASNYTMAKGTTDMTIASVCTALASLLESVGVKPEYVIVDNMKTAVIKHRKGKGAVMNDSFMHFLSSMDVDAEACNPRSPTSKNEVEKGNSLLADRVLPRLRKQKFESLEDANRALMELTGRYINREEFTGTEHRGSSRTILFEKFERQACRPLGRVPVYHEHFESLKVDRFYCVRINGTCYSVPFTLAGSYLRADIIDGTVHIFGAAGEVACHPRAPNGTPKVISPEHMPPSHRAMHEKRNKYATDEDIINEASRFGEGIASFCRAVLARPRRREARKACIAVINLCRRSRHVLSELNDAARAAIARPEREWNYYTVEKFFNEIMGEKRMSGSYCRQTGLDFGKAERCESKVHIRGAGAFRVTPVHSKGENK